MHCFYYYFYRKRVPALARIAAQPVATGTPTARNRSKRATKPFWPIHETIRKQIGGTSMSNRRRVDASEASHEPLNSFGGPLDPPEDRGRRPRGRHRGVS